VKIYTFNDVKPGINDRILAYKTEVTDNYPAGWYIGRFLINHIGELNTDAMYIVIEAIGNTSMDNFRPIQEFSHWMRLPNAPLSLRD
jgi:hypothetical protein